ncbi:MAG: amino acid permease [Planctomycetes bacterium]|nr:amino acid permease [Planctomycetota bacterium]
MGNDPDYSAQNASAARRPQLSLWDSICLIVGIIIGASIYQAPPEIFRSSGSAEMGMLAWIVGGIVSMIGALCYAELASCYRTSGGDYTYLTKAYGPKVGFIFAWAELSVIRTGGSIAFMAYVFANYAEQFHNLGPNSKLIYAVGGILSLTFINAVGLKPGRLVQNSLTTANILGLGSLCLIGFVWFFWPAAGGGGNGVIAPNAGGCNFEVSLALTMVLVFYAYGGWNEAAFIASEVQNPKRNIRRALILGTMLVTVIYIGVNLAYLAALGYSGVCNSQAVAGDMFALPFGEPGRKAISALVMISALGSVNGLLFTGMRLYGTFGSDHKFFTWLAGRGDRPHVAYGALFAQAAFSLLLISVVELATHWRQLLAAIAPHLNLAVPHNFHTSGGIYKLVTCTAPVFWIFFLLTGCSLFLLRIKEPERQRPFRVPFYPVLPLFFCGACAFMLWRSGMYALEQEPAEAFIVGLLMLIGIPLCFLSARATRKAQQETSDEN